MEMRKIGVTSMVTPKGIGGILAASMWLEVCGAAFAGQPYPVFQLQGTPDLKAEADEDAAWRHIPWATGLHKIGAARQVAVQTRFKVGFTKDALYFLVQCEEPDMASITASTREDNPGIWREDSVEVFVHPMDTEHVFQVLANARGARRNMLNSLDMFQATDPSKSAAGATQGEDGYSVTVMIPFRSVRDAIPADGETWKFNVLRNRMINGPDAEDRVSTFSRLYRGALEPDNYREMVFFNRPASEEDGWLVYDNAAAEDDAGIHQVVNLSFNEGGGEIANAQSAILNHGNMQAAGWSKKGKIGYCAELKKEGEYIEVAHSESLGSIRTELTIDLWAYFDLEELKGTRATLVTKTPDGGFGFGYLLEYADIAPKSQALGFYLAESWQMRGHHVLNNAIQTTGWHHIVATFNANTMKIVLYIDGVKAFSQNSLIEEIAPSTKALTIGAIERDHNDRTRVSTFRGRIDEVKIWSKALTAEDVQNYYGHMFVKSVPVSPAHLSTVADARPVLSWTAAMDGTAAILELSSTPKFTGAGSIREKKAESRYRPGEPLSPGVWYWRIFSTDADGDPTSASRTRAFIVSGGTGESAYQEADTTPPVITGVRPFAFSTASGDRPAIRARWTDNASVDLATARLFLDEEDVTTQAAISPQGLEFTPEEPLRDGPHTIRIELRDRAGNRANTVKQSFSVGAELPLRVELRDRRIHVNQELFFPVIYYHTFAGATAEQMVDWGWNTFHFMVSSPQAHADRYETKDLGAAMGMYCDAITQCGEMLFADFINYYGTGDRSILSTEDVLTALKRHPKILAYTMDEPNGRPEGAGWAEDFYATARAVGETRPVLPLLNSPADAGVFGRDGIGDGVGLNSYPYPSQPALLVARAIDVAREQTHFRKPVWMTLQAFCDWGTKLSALSELEAKQLEKGELDCAIPPGGMRCMMYLALAHEATGLHWWVFHPGYLGHSGYWRDAKAEIIDCVSQARHLAPMLLAPDAPVDVRVKPDDVGLHVKAKAYEGHIYVIAVNSQEDLPVSGRFVMPEGKKFNKVDVLFEDRSFRPGKEAGSFEDLFAPRAVHVYRID